MAILVTPTENTAKSSLLNFIEKLKVRLTKQYLMNKQINRGNKMNENEILAEIRDANLNYLMLAQQLIRSDKATAIFRLGISKEIADLLEGLSNLQLLKLSSTNMMLARFRFDDSAILGMLTNYTKNSAQAHLHTAVLMAGQHAEAVA